MKLHESKTQGIILAILTLIGNGVVSVIDKYASSQAPTPIIFSLQSIFCSLIFVFLFSCIFLNKQFIPSISKLTFKNWRLLILIGLFSSGLFLLFRFIGLQQSTGTFASLSQIVTASLTVPLAWIFLKEKLSPRFWVLFLIIIGAMYIVSTGRIGLATVKNGDLFILLGTVALAVGNIFSRLAVKDINPAIVSLGRFVFGFIFVFIVTFFFGYNTILTTGFSIWIVISGFIWAANTVMFNMAIKRIGVTLTVSILMVAPTITMALEFGLLHHSFSSVQIGAAIVVVLAGLGIILF